MKGKALKRKHWLEQALFFLEAALAFDHEPVEIIENHEMKNCVFLMSRSINSRYGARSVPRNGLGS